MNKIENILDKYFEGDTSAAEERELRRFFATKEVPRHLEVYKPLFAYFDEEIARTETVVISTARRRLFRRIAGIAAAVLVLLTIGQVFVFPGKTFCGDNYVVINGRCYTDRQTIREHAFHALQEVSETDRALFPPLDEEDTDRQIIENQFRQLGDFFTDDE